ncbi:ATP11 protein-domain-containing protein [Phycomyces blakesleeanus]
MLLPTLSRRIVGANAARMALAMPRQVTNVQTIRLASSPCSIWGRYSYATVRHHSIDAQTIYEAKYAEKLRKAAEKEGITVEDLKLRIKEDALKRRKEATPSPVARNPSSAPKTSTDKTVEKVTSKAKMPYDSSAPSLDKIVKLDLLQNEDVKSITKIWTEYHSDKDCITAVIPSEVYDTLYKRSREFPMFVLPMPRESGIEFFLLQFNFHQCNFTSLLEYKTKGSEARPFLTISHFPELSESKGIVLMKGEISDKPRMIDAQNAQFLVFAIQQFYVTGGERKLGLVEKFHKAPQEFDYQELLDEVERLV